MTRQFLTAFAVILSVSGTVDAGFHVGDLSDGGDLVGTFVGNGPGTQDTWANVNAGIDAHNSAFSLGLTGATSFLGKLEGSTVGQFSGSEWTFYEADENGTDGTILNGTINLKKLDGPADVLNKKIAAFSYTGPSNVEYYTFKGGTNWSLFSYLGNGQLNPLFLDTDYDLDTLPTYSDMRGPTLKGLSHFSYFGSGDAFTTAVPEPSTLLVWSLLGGIGFVARTRMRMRRG